GLGVYPAAAPEGAHALARTGRARGRAGRRDDPRSHAAADRPRQLPQAGVAELLEKTKLRAIRIHDLRHTFASLLISQGESLAYVREQMGHHSIALTVDTYGHLVPGGNRAAVDRLASCIKSAGMRAPSGPPLDQGGPQSRRSAIGSPNSAALQVEPKGVEPSTSRVRF